MHVRLAVPVGYLVGLAVVVGVASAVAVAVEVAGQVREMVKVLVKVPGTGSRCECRSWCACPFAALFFFSSTYRMET